MKLWKILSSYQCSALCHEEKCTEKVVESMLKIKIELIKHENANATTRAIGFQVFESRRKMKNFKILYIFVFLGKFIFFDEALYESSVRKPG